MVQNPIFWKRRWLFLKQNSYTHTLGFLLEFDFTHTHTLTHSLYFFQRESSIQAFIYLFLIWLWSPWSSSKLSLPFLCQSLGPSSSPVLSLRPLLLFCQVKLFAIPWTAAHQTSLSFPISQSLLKPLASPVSLPSLGQVYELQPTFCQPFSCIMTVTFQL